MNRRSFIALTGAAVAWPHIARAQQAVAPVIGYLHSRSAGTSAELVESFKQGLRENGFIDGQNVRVVYRWGEGRFDHLPALARELAQTPVSVMAAAGGEQTVLAARAASPTIPVVFGMSGDPVRLGLAESFNRPGRNTTGVNILTASLEPKRLGLLHEMVPQAKMVGAFVDATFAAFDGQLRDLTQAAAQAGVGLRAFAISNEREIDAAFEAIAAENIKALAVAGSPFFDSHREKLIGLTARRSVPAIYHFREYAAAGGLMSYGIDIRDVHRQIGLYVGQILKGARAGDLPIVLPSKFAFVINLKTAKALGLTIPSGLLAAADEVIE